MPNQISLAAYVVKVWNRGDRNYEVLSDFDGDGADLFGSLETVMQGIKANTLDEQELQQAIGVPKIVKQARTLAGIIETGEYGRESSIINMGTKKMVYRRQKEDAEMWPFYFFIEIPKEVEDGLLILQRTAHYGIRSILHWVLGTAFEQQYADFQLRLFPLVDQKRMEKLINGEVQKVSFVRKIVPHDLADSFDKGHKEVQGSMELVIRAKRGSSLPVNRWLSSIFKAHGQPGIFAIEEGTRYRYEDVKATVKLGHSTRTIDFGRPERLRSYYDITDATEIGNDGHPEYESIHAQAQKLAAELRAILYGGA